MAKKSAKVTKKAAKKERAPRQDTTKGVGKKLAIYVPKEDEWVIDKLMTIQSDRRKEGYRTSLSYELVRLVKERIQQM